MSDSTAVVAVSDNIEFAAAVVVVVVVVAEQRSSFARSQRIPTRTAFGADVLMAAAACRTFRPLASARFLASCCASCAPLFARCVLVVRLHLKINRYCGYIYIFPEKIYFIDFFL